MEDENEVVVPETTEEVIEEVIEETPEETIEEVKAKLAKAEEIAENQRIRAEKAEKAEKSAKEKKESKSDSTLSTSDLLAVMKANVHDDDMERVERFAKSEGVSVRDALKNPELKAILDLREEQRSTAAAANVSNVRRGSTKVSDEVLIQNASNGKLPEDEDGIARLVAAKMKQKR